MFRYILIERTFVSVGYGYIFFPEYDAVALDEPYL